MYTAIFTLELTTEERSIDYVIEHLQFSDVPFALARATSTKAAILSVSIQSNSSSSVVTDAEAIIEQIECIITEAGSPYFVDVTVLAKSW